MRTVAADQDTGKPAGRLAWLSKDGPGSVGALLIPGLTTQGVAMADDTYSPENIRRWPCGERIKEPRSTWVNHRAKVKPRIRRAVYERDNWTCQRCGLYFDQRPEQLRHAPATRVTKKKQWEAHTLESVWLELHHIIPYSKYGADTKRNLVALCSTCNYSIGDKRVAA